ncbi:hypothetical protein GCM10010503_38980 [Streptomyces lucensis JCM 4490]|uniref:Uncharacterized protein n=1 Tax=Streptomyces lucensis JCM 4490 TaxID=1306176 RepID=A0A918J838_9ACTN|nr:hypothetical protein [Streptomyces lucensis]GGW58157.1 hypothetical protein GCM10010503_38980 [Streptomyces lucensis JCM 4490]
MGPVSDKPRLGAHTITLLQRAEHARVEGLDRISETRLAYRRQRHGVQVHAVWTQDLSEEQLRVLVEFRIVQYLRVGFVEPQRLEQVLMQGQELSSSSPDDIHVVAATDDGLPLCSGLLRAPGTTDVSLRMVDRDRPRFPVEEVHGTGVFDRLRLLPQLPVVRVRELGGFVKRKVCEPLSQVSLRAPVEVGIGLFRVATGPLALPMDALIGDLEPTVAKLNVDFFGVRPVMLRGTSPRVPEGSFLGPRYSGRQVHPFAVFTSDLTTALPRLHEVDAALDEPGLVNLLKLRSSLVPGEPSTLSWDGADDLLAAQSDAGTLADTELHERAMHCCAYRS